MSAGSAAAASATTTSTTPTVQAVPFADFTANYNSTGGIGGGEVGYNWQSGSYRRRRRGATGSGPASRATTPRNSTRRVSRRRRGGCGQPALGRHACWHEAAMPSIAGCCSSRAVGPSAASSIPIRRPSGLSTGSHVQANGLTGRWRCRLRDHQQHHRQVRISLYNFNGYSGGRPKLTRTARLPYSVTETTYSVVTLGLDFKFGGPVVTKY